MNLSSNKRRNNRKQPYCSRFRSSKSPGRGLLRIQTQGNIIVNYSRRSSLEEHSHVSKESCEGEEAYAQQHLETLNKRFLSGLDVYAREVYRSVLASRPSYAPSRVGKRDKLYELIGNLKLYWNKASDISPKSFIGEKPASNSYIERNWDLAGNRTSKSKSLKVPF